MPCEGNVLSQIHLISFRGDIFDSVQANKSKKIITLKLRLPVVFIVNDLFPSNLSVWGIKNTSVNGKCILKQKRKKKARCSKFDTN